jgi:Zn-dependent protease with chaperone function
MMLNLYLSSVGQKQQLFTEIKSSPLIDLIQTKTGLTLSSFRIVASTRMYALMVGLPNKPYMVLSSALNQAFSDSEKEYIVLHESGHYLLRHGMKEAIAFILLYAIGCLIIRKLPFWSIPCIGIMLGLLYIQVGMHNEYEADHFALIHITDPQGMITATHKFKAQQFPKIDDHSLTWKLLLRSTPYYERVNMANEEIEARK